MEICQFESLKIETGKHSPVFIKKKMLFNVGTTAFLHFISAMFFFLSKLIYVSYLK